MNAHDIESALATRYSAPEYAFLTQVRNTTCGARSVRTADAIPIRLEAMKRDVEMLGSTIARVLDDWKSIES